MTVWATLLLVFAFASPLSAGADSDGSPSIFWAALANDVSMAKYYVARGGAVNIVDPSGMSPLMHAADKGHVKMVTYLLRVGADPYLKVKNGPTAIQLSRTEAVREILCSWMRDHPAP